MKSWTYSTSKDSSLMIYPDNRLDFLFNFSHIATGSISELSSYLPPFSISVIGMQEKSRVVSFREGTFIMGCSFSLTEFNKLSMMDPRFFTNKLVSFQPHDTEFFDAAKVNKDSQNGLDERLEGSLNYLSQLEGWNVRDMAKYSCLSQKQFYRIFKAQLGIGPKRFLRIEKLSRFRNILNNNPHSTLDEIAFQCGYNDVSHLVKESVNLCTCNPSAFRKNVHFLQLE